MKEKTTGKNRIRLFAYHLVYAIPVGLAIFGQMRVLLAFMTENGTIGKGESAGYIHGLIYAGTFMGSFLVGFALSLIITLSKWTKTAFAFLIIASMIILMLFEARPERILVASLLTLVPVVAADVIRASLKKNDESKVVFLAPFFLIIFLALQFIPVSDKPVNWSGVADVLERISEKGREILDRLNIGIYDYESADMGFDGNGRLSSGIRNNDREVMLLFDDNPREEKVYLAGKVFSDFNGREWTIDKGNDLPGRMIDTIETLSAAQETYPYNVDDVCASAVNEIVIRDMRTEFAFVPSKMVVGTTGSLKVLNDGDNIYFSEKKRFGYGYKVGYYVLNRGGADLIKYRKKISEEIWNKVSANYKKGDGSVYTYDDLLSYRVSVKEVYGQRPELSEELYQLIELISGGTDDEISDYQRMKNIESWLASGEYNTETNIPADASASPESFLDYFLTENTSGYCSYYATAFVLMARSVGMPARYVEGFQAPAGSSEGESVTSSLAHSWPEVYFEDVGWVRFEPTPGFESVIEWGEPLREPEYYELHKDDETVSAEDPDNLTSLTAEEAAELERRMLEAKRKVREEKLRKRRMMLTAMAITLGSVLIVLTVFVSLRILVGEIILRRTKGKNKVILLCERCFMILMCMGMKPGKGETLEEFKRRILKEDDTCPTGFIEIYEELLYAGSDRYGENDSSGECAVQQAGADHTGLKKMIAGSGKPRAKARYLWNLIVMKH